MHCIAPCGFLPCQDVCCNSVGNKLVTTVQVNLLHTCSCCHRVLQFRQLRNTAATGTCVGMPVVNAWRRDLRALHRFHYRVVEALRKTLPLPTLPIHPRQWPIVLPALRSARSMLGTAPSLGKCLPTPVHVVPHVAFSANAKLCFEFRQPQEAVQRKDFAARRCAGALSSRQKKRNFNGRLCQDTSRVMVSESRKVTTSRGGLEAEKSAASSSSLLRSSSHLSLQV